MTMRTNSFKVGDRVTIPDGNGRAPGVVVDITRRFITVEYKVAGLFWQRAIPSEAWDTIAPAPSAP